MCPLKTRFERNFRRGDVVVVVIVIAIAVAIIIVVVVVVIMSSRHPRRQVISSPLSRHVNGVVLVGVGIAVVVMSSRSRRRIRRVFRFRALGVLLPCTRRRG